MNDFEIKQISREEISGFVKTLNAYPGAIFYLVINLIGCLVKNNILSQDDLTEILDYLENEVAIEPSTDIDELSDVHALFYLVRRMRTIFGLGQPEKDDDD